MSEARTASREALIDKIRKLAKMTVASGCTEAEAATAAAGNIDLGYGQKVEASNLRLGRG